MTTQHKLEELQEKLSVAVSLIKVFSSYDLPISKSPSGESFIAATGFETLKTSIIISAVDAELFTKDQLLEAQSLIEKLSPLMDQAILAKSNNEKVSTPATPAAVAGKVKAKLEINNN